jgi:SiaC family regulatory phosphoprotein
MKQIQITGTKHSPNVELNPNGEIKITGRCIIEDPVTFFKPIFSWVQEAQFKTIHIEFKLEYLNTSSVKQIFHLLLLIKSITDLQHISVSWYYEIEDDSSLDLGRDIASQVSLPFKFIEFTEYVIKFD